MAVIDEKILDDYINGEYIDEELVKRLENNKLFMERVIDKTNDYKMYYYCSEKVKSDSGFIRFLMKKYMNNLDFLCEISDYYFERCDKDPYAIEIALLARVILKKQEDDRYLKYEQIRDLMYGSLRFLVESEKRYREDDYLFQSDIGMGFWYVFDVHKNNELVIDFYAKKMLEEIFLLSYYGLDRILHNQYSSIEEIEDTGLYSVLIKIISIYDNMLSGYVRIPSHRNLLKKPIEKLNTVLKRWDSYVDVNESAKYDSISNEVEKYMDDKYDTSTLSGEELLTMVGKQLGIKEKMIHYQLIDETDIKMLEEDEENYHFIICTSSSDRANYNTVKNIVKSTLFPNQTPQKEEKPAGKILKLDDYRACRQEKTGQN